jgi:hypothetical protein
VQEGIDGLLSDKTRSSPIPRSARRWPSELWR